MGVVSHCFIVVTTDVHGSVTSLAATFTPRPTFIVQHQIPDYDTFTPVVHCAKGYFTHIFHQTFLQVTTIIPHADRSFGKDQFLVRTLLSDIVQFFAPAAIIVVSGSGQESGGYFIIIHLNGVLLLIGHVIVVVIMIESINLRIQSGSLESRTKSVTHKGQFFLPTHEQRCGISPIQRFILWSNGININTFITKCLNPFHEVSGIILIVIRIQLSACPGIKGFLFLQVIHLHPFGACPRRAQYLDGGINRQNIF